MSTCAGLALILRATGGLTRENVPLQPSFNGVLCNLVSAEASIGTTRHTGKHLHHSTFHCQVTCIRVLGQHFRHPDFFPCLVYRAELSEDELNSKTGDRRLTLLL